MGNNAGRPHDARRALRELLATGAGNRICTVVAAAGWGKSHAVRSLPVARADVSHGGAADLVGFSTALRDALAPHLKEPADLPEPAAEAEAAEGTGDVAVDHAAALCAWLRTGLTGRVAVVVDNLHELPPDSPAVRLVEGLCRHADERLHLVLLSRRELPFSLARQRGQGLVTEIEALDLAMDRTEIAALVRVAVPGSPAALSRLVWERTDGWPAAVRLAVQALRPGTGEDECRAALDRLVRPGERLHDYLREEVLGAEPEHVRELLRWVAVVGHVDAESATATGMTDAPELLVDLARRGLVRPLPGAGRCWSLTGLVQDYLDQELDRAPAQRAALHSAAAAEYVRREAFGPALRHASAAGDRKTSGALVASHGAWLVNGGQVSVVLDADLAPEHEADPDIQRVLGQASQVLGHLADAHESFRRAGRNGDPLDPGLAWRLGTIAYNLAEFDTVFELRERTSLRDEDTADEARWLALVAASRRAVGDYVGCRADTDRALATAQRSADPAALAAGHTVRAALAAAEGDRRQADAHGESALAAAAAGNDQLQRLRLLVQRAAVLGELGLPRDAVVAADKAVRLGERCGDVLLVAQALTTRAAAMARLGTVEPALRDFALARDAFQRAGSRLLAWPLCGLGDVYRMRGQLARARAVYEQALALAEPHRDVLGIGSALVGLARVRAADDPVAAHQFAQRAVRLGEGMRHVQALLARGWVAAVTGERAAAAADASLAAAAARQRHDDPGLAEALVLGALCSSDPGQRDRALAEAIHIWREAGCRIEEAGALLVASRVGATAADLGTAFAMETLRAFEVDLRAPRPAGPLAVLASSAPSVSIRALGVFQVSHNGMPIQRTAWQSRKARQLLKIIVARRRPVPREQLMELLWPEVDTSRAANRLSVLLSALRDILQPVAGQAEAGPLVTDGTGVWLDHALVDVDVERFIEQANAALEAHRQRRDDALVRLVAAEAAYTGEFLEDDPYQEWAASLAEEVRATHAALLRALVHRLRRSGELDEMARYTLRLLDKDGYDEGAHLALVGALVEAGRHGEARRRYQTYVKAMTELGVEPEPFDADRRGRVRRRR